MNKQITNSAYLSYKSNKNQTLFILKHPLFSATISEFGGQLLSFEPTDAQQLIWLSDSAKLDGSKPIRGGAPICWPWFGSAPVKFEGEPQHGYARNLYWEIGKSCLKRADCCVQICVRSSESCSVSMFLGRSPTRWSECGIP